MLGKVVMTKAYSETNKDMSTMFSSSLRVQTSNYSGQIEAIALLERNKNKKTRKNRVDNAKSTEETYIFITFDHARLGIR